MKVFKPPINSNYCSGMALRQGEDGPQEKEGGL